jgi:nicotinamidase-related amidase
MDPRLVPHLERSVLVTIDVQTDTLDGQPLEIPGTSAVVPAIARLAEAFRAASRPIIHVVRLYRADGSNAEPLRVELVSGPRPLLRPGEPGRLLAPGILPEQVEFDDEFLLGGGMQPVGPLEWVMYKPRWGAFFKTTLDEHLKSLDINTVVFAGCNFPNCPRTSIYEASERDYRLVVSLDAVSGLYDRALSELENIGVTLLSSEMIGNALETVDASPSR